MHLTAASSLILTLYGMPENASQSSESCDTIPNFISPTNAALNFFTSIIVWFDCLACISIASIPHLVNHHTEILNSPASSTDPSWQKKSPMHKLDLSAIMGCQNWVMLIISEIAQLGNSQEDKVSGMSLDFLRVAELAKDIQGRLELGITGIRAELDDLRLQYSGNPPYYYSEVYNRYTVLVVTNMFASAALIYLQTSVTSVPSPFHIQDPLQRVIAAMHMIPDPRMVRGLVWPLCVAGCMASSPSDQEFFRSAASAAIKDARNSGNSSKALDILEMAWKLQKEEGRLIDCAKCIQRLGTCVLLV